MRNVGGYSVRSAWRNMGDTNHVPTAGGSIPSTSRITEVSIILCAIVVVLIEPFSLGYMEINILH